MVKKSILSIILCVIFFMADFMAISQKNAGYIGDTAKIQLIARAHPDKVILRWAPTSPLAWQLANKYGYTLERLTMTKKGKLVKERKLIKLIDNQITLWSEDKWETMIREAGGTIDNYVAIAVQALFGSSFQLTETYSGDISKAVEKVQENEKRFTFALFSADQSLKVAEAMGLLFIDNQVVSDEKYIYRVYTNVPAENLQIDTGFVYTGPADFSHLPKPLEFNGLADENAVTLSWDRKMFESIYSDYQVERSENKKDFFLLGTLPFINTLPDDYTSPARVYRIDTLPQTGKDYYYRVRGRTPFCEFGPWSDTISVRASNSNDYRPNMVSASVIENKRVLVKWEFPIEKNGEILYFGVYRASKANGSYTEIGAKLDPALREFSDNKPLPGNYYVVRAINNQGVVSSFPAFAQLVDSVAPVRPKMPVATADTSGMVTLSWEASPDEDVMGYRVFRANFKDSEYGQITGSPIVGTSYTEKVELDNLEPGIYYKIAAVDYNFNQSELSPEVMLLKPDTIQPVPPLIKQIKSTEKGPVLHWVHSPSKDIDHYLIKQKTENDTQWEMVAKIMVADTPDQYTDSLAIPGQLVAYAMFAIDKNGNQSAPSKILYAKKMDSGIKPGISNIKTYIDREKKTVEISWKYNTEQVESYLIYRTTEGNPLLFYKKTSGVITKFVDNNNTINTKYLYRIKAVFKDGTESGFSERINVNF